MQQTVLQADAVQQGYAQFLRDQDQLEPFTIFGTHTVRFDYPGNIHPEALTKRLRVWCSMVNERLYGSRYYKRRQSLQAVVAWELQKRGVWHLHTMMRGRNVERLLMSPDHSWARNAWWELSGTCKLLPIDSIGGVTGYLSKYVSKGGQIDFEPTRAWEPASPNINTLFPTPTEEKGEFSGRGT